MTPVLGETYVELNECQMKIWDETAEEAVVHVVVTANNNQILDGRDGDRRHLHSEGRRGRRH